MENGHIDCETHFTRTDIIRSQYSVLKPQDKLKFLQEVDSASYVIAPYCPELALALSLLGIDLTNETQREIQRARHRNKDH